MELLSMGGYGAFVWSSYGLTLVVVIVGIMQGRRRHRRIEADIRRTLQITENSE